MMNWRVLLALGLPLAGLLEWGAHVYFANSAPSLEEWRALKPALVESLQAEEYGSRIAQGSQQKRPLILAAPRWAEPLARAAFGSEWMPLSHVARPDESAFSFAVEVSVLGETAGLSSWQTAWVRELGVFRLRGLVNPEAETVGLDFVDALQPERVSVSTVKGGRQVPCKFGQHRVSNGDLHGHPTFPRSRFACRGGSWHFVGVTVIEDQNYRPRRCLWAHPGSGEELSIVFSDVEIRHKLRGYGGLPYFRERESHGTPVDMEVYVGGEQVGSYRHEDGDGWSPFEFSTGRFAGKQLPVEFRVSSKRAAHREFCFQADIR